MNPVAAAMAGASAGSAFGPVGTVIGGVVGAGVGAVIGWNVIGPMFAGPQSTATLSTGLPPVFWPADKGAGEWGGVTVWVSAKVKVVFTGSNKVAVAVRRIALELIQKQAKLLILLAIL